MSLEQSRSFIKFGWFLVAAIFLVAGVMVAISQTKSSTPTVKSVNGIFFEQARKLPEVELVNHKGEQFSLNQLPEKWSLLFFGYTSCPDICPITLQMISSALKAAKQQSPNADINVVLVTVDPSRDTPEKLAEYMRFFNPAFFGITGKDSQLTTLASKLGALYNPPNTEEENYTVDHSSAIFVLDPHHDFRAILTTPHTVDSLTQDILTLTQ